MPGSNPGTGGGSTPGLAAVLAVSGNASGATISNAKIASGTVAGLTADDSTNVDLSGGGGSTVNLTLPTGSSMTDPLTTPPLGCIRILIPGDATPKAVFYYT